MFILIQIFVVFLLLLLTAFAVPKLQPLLYTSLFLIVFLHLLTAVIIPFVKNYAQLFSVIPNSFATLLIGSAILFYISEIITEHIKEAGFGSLASLTHFAIKISILTLWIHETSHTIEILSALIKK